MNEPKKTRGEGDTVPVQGEKQQRAPRMPHERDESADQQASTEPSNRRVGEQAHADARRGVADTTRGAEADATYEKLRKERPSSSGKPRP